MFKTNQEPAADAPARELGADELSGVAGGAPLIAGKVCVMTCKTCGARFYGETRADAKARLFEHMDFYKH